MCTRCSVRSSAAHALDDTTCAVASGLLTTHGVTNASVGHTPTTHKHTYAAWRLTGSIHRGATHGVVASGYSDGRVRLGRTVDVIPAARQRLSVRARAVGALGTVNTGFPVFVGALAKITGVTSTGRIQPRMSRQAHAKHLQRLRLRTTVVTGCTRALPSWIHESLAPGRVRLRHTVAACNAPLATPGVTIKRSVGRKVPVVPPKSPHAGGT